MSLANVAYLPDGSIDPANVQVAMENPVNSGNFVPVVLPTDGISANGNWQYGQFPLAMP